MCEKYEVEYRGPSNVILDFDMRKKPHATDLLWLTHHSWAWRKLFRNTESNIRSEHLGLVEDAACRLIPL